MRRTSRTRAVVVFPDAFLIKEGLDSQRPGFQGAHADRRVVPVRRECADQDEARRKARAPFNDIIKIVSTKYLVISSIFSFSCCLFNKQLMLPLFFAGRDRSRFARSGPPGFFRCSDVEDGLAPSSARLRLRSAEPPSQALKNATSAAFFTHAISAPLAPLRVRGAYGQKNPTADAREAQAPRIRELSPQKPGLRPRSPEVFRVCPVPHITAGCGDGGAMNACRRRRRLALAKKMWTWRSEAKRSAAVSSFRGCERGPATAAP